MAVRVLCLGALDRRPHPRRDHLDTDSFEGCGEGRGAVAGRSGGATHQCRGKYTDMKSLGLSRVTARGGCRGRGGAAGGGAFPGHQEPAGEDRKGAAAPARGPQRAREAGFIEAGGAGPRDAPPPRPPRESRHQNHEWPQLGGSARGRAPRLCAPSRHSARTRGDTHRVQCHAAAGEHPVGVGGAGLGPLKSPQMWPRSAEGGRHPS